MLILIQSQKRTHHLQKYLKKIQGKGKLKITSNILSRKNNDAPKYAIHKQIKSSQLFPWWHHVLDLKKKKKKKKLKIIILDKAPSQNNVSLLVGEILSKAKQRMNCHV